MRIIEQFSRYPRIKESNGHPAMCLVSDHELETNMRILCHSDPNAKAEFWARFFLKTLDCEPLALRHMSAYLYDLGYRVANKVHDKLSNLQQYTQLGHDRYALWQIAYSFSCKPTEFFRDFDPVRPLENYAYKKMEGRIRDEIVRLGMGRLRSDWALLRYSGRAYLTEALQNQGYKQPQLDCYLLAWHSFREIYAPQRATGGRKLPAPTDEQLQQIANLYNKLLVQSPQVAALGTADRTKIEGYLLECIQALRKYQTRYFVPLDAPGGANEDSPPLLETIPDPESEFGREQIEIQEPALALMTALTDLLARMDEKTDNCLLLMYGFDLDYRSIAPLFEVYYTTVRNRYNRATQQLLGQVAQWAQEKLGVTPDSESLNEMHAPLKECLNKYYEGLIFQSVFRTAWQQLDYQRRNILHLHYFRQMDELAIACQLQLGELEVSNELVTGRQELAAAIREWIHNRLNIPPDLLNPLADKIVTLVQRLIANFPDLDFASTEKQKCQMFYQHSQPFTQTRYG
jgi:DNA-directed RNA polymerase specialized sigma24 family protein